jgi:hypothetical protein
MHAVQYISMRKTLTVSPFLVEAAARVRQAGPAKDAMERRVGHPVRSEAAALTQLAEIGARVVLEDAASAGYEQLADLIAMDPTPEVQVSLGAPIAGEDPEQFESLFQALAE